MARNNVSDSTKRDGTIDLTTFRKLKWLDGPDAKATPRPLTDRERLAKKQREEGGNYRSLIDRSGRRT